MSNMLMSLRIQSPAHLYNKTIGNQIAQMKWTDAKVSHFVETVLQTEQNSLCLEHGRKPLIPVSMEIQG